MVESKFRRLPTSVLPRHYDLTLRPEAEEAVLHGQIAVEVQVVSQTQEIVINGFNIQVKGEATFTPSGSPPQRSSSVEILQETETIRIKFPSPLKEGEGVLAFEFEAEITDNMKGLYRTKGEKGYNLVTHFEPVHARRCFPGWDEPEFKATFSITLIVPKDSVAVSNMPQEEESVYGTDKTRKVCRFGKSPKMSTYLVALVVGDFESIEKKSEEGALVRVFTVKGKKEEGRYSLDLAARLLSFYQEYFGVPYPLPKCDLVAVPEFPIGGMENYGLITFHDTRLLVNEEQSSAWNRQLVSLIVSHEVSHLWFGDLVTMRWWQDLWLKEGFAKFMEYLAVNHFYPEFDVWTQFVSRMQIAAFSTDALANSHPVEVPVNDPAEIDEIFDAISYNKGASVIKMLYGYVGDASFRKGLKSYLEKFQYSNAETTDLWEALEGASGKPVGKFMATFTKQMGFPIVTVESIRKVDGGAELALKQEKFWANPEKAKENQDWKWAIPLTCCTEGKPNEVIPLEIFDQNEAKVIVPNVGEKEWVKLNAASTGFYRVRYGKEVLQQFKAAIREKKLSPLDRLGLLDDVFSAVKAGLSSTTEIFNLLEAYKEEDNYSVWSCIRAVTDSVTQILLKTDQAAKWDAYCVKLYKPMKEKMGWTAKDGESHPNRLLRALVISQLIAHGDQDTIEEACTLFAKEVKEGNAVSSDLRTAVYRATVCGGEAKPWNALMELFKKSDNSEEKSRILQTLGYTSNQDLLKKTLEFGISSEVNSSDVTSVVFPLEHSSMSQQVGWDWFKRNIKIFQEKYPGGMLICSLVRMVLEHFVGDEIAKEIEAFMKENPIHGTERTVQQALERIRVNTAWQKRDLKEISAYLAA